MLRKIYEKAEKLLANRLLALIILIVVLYCVLIGRVFVLQLSMEEDQKLLGGFILKAEDVEYDYSLKAQLKQLFGA